MRFFDDLCLTPPQTWHPDDIRALREREHVSQPIFAYYLNVPKNLVSDWERGVKKPSGAAMRLLSVVHKHGLSVIA
jgi:putative transcriptional regulator